MEQIALTILLVIGIILAAAIWLITRSIIAREQIEELIRRVDNLQLELQKVKQQAASSPPVAGEAAPAPPAPPATARDAAVATLWPVPETAAPPMAKSEATPVSSAVPPPIPVRPPTPTRPLPAPMAPQTAAPPEPAAGPAAALPPLIPQVAPVTRPPFEPVWQHARTAAAVQASPSPVPAKDSFEMRIGKYWAIRVGVVVFLTALALGANLAYQDIVSRLGAGGKLALLYLASAGLLGAGAWWQRRGVKESLKNYAQVLFAGGLAAVYFTTYAAHYLPPVRVIGSPLLDGALLLVWAGFIAWIADRRKSEVMAFFAISLAFFTAVTTRVGEFTLYSNLLLTIAAVVFLVRNRWIALSFTSLIMSYAGYAFWRFLHGDGWHWASSEEGLFLGAGFLAGYWVVFTAATFLSTSRQLAGPNRATFLTLNNGAYFALFLLTMLQTHSGGFWRFCLIYGSVLVALARLARQVLPAEPLTKNSYLTQGLTLVTLGFISRFAGLHLALVLGVESIGFFVLATQRRSAVLKFFAYATALLATGWCAAGLKHFDSQDLWMALGLGGMLAFNAAWAHRDETQAGPEGQRWGSSAFTLLAFASWAMAAWFDSAEPHLPAALVLAVGSAVFYQLVGGHQIAVPKFTAYAAAAVAAPWCAGGLTPFDAGGLWIAFAAGAIMVANAVRANRAAGDSAQWLRPETTAFTLLAFAPWLAATWFNASGAHLPLVLAAEAVALTFSIYWLRVREITVLGQMFLISAQLAWLLHFATETPPWWNPLLIIAATLGLSHWWQRQRTVVVGRNFFVCHSALFALAAVGILLVWLQPLVSAPAWLALSSLLAVAVTAYGLVTRAWTLAVCGQLFLGVSTWAFLEQLINDHPLWCLPLAPLAALAGLSLATVAWLAGHPDVKTAAREPLLQVATVYRWLALALSLAWIWEYVPDRQRVWACMLAALACLGLAIWRQSREALLAAAVYAAAALTLLWGRDGAVMDVYVPNLLALLALFAAQQSLRRLGSKLLPHENIHGTIAIIAGLSLWRYLSCWTEPFTSGFYVTMTWAGFAVAAFAAGIWLHERFLRWFGMGVLTASVGRVMVVDVWNQEKLGRVLAFLALGVALFVVGFVYNKYEEKIRRWL